MDILKLTTSPAFEIVPRKNLDVLRTFKFKLINEFTKVTQDVLASITILPNENYQVTLVSFPTGKAGDKISYTIVDNLTNEVISLGKLMIVSASENIQNYSKISTAKFYN